MDGCDVESDNRLHESEPGMQALLRGGLPRAAFSQRDLGAARDDAADAARPWIDDVQVLDATVLRELDGLKLGSDFVKDFVEQCLRDAARCLAEFDRAGIAGNWDQVREANHALKGVAGNMGASQIVAANWDSLVFDTGAPALRRVPMLEPTRGTEEHVGELLATAASAADLLDRLGR